MQSGWCVPYFSRILTLDPLLIEIGNMFPGFLLFGRVFFPPPTAQNTTIEMR